MDAITVTQLNNWIKSLVDSEPGLSNIAVRGELSNYKIYPSGHHYFTLKDAESSLRCVMFRSAASKLRFKPENGMGVTASGRISVFPRDGAYQLYCTGLMPEGMGASAGLPRRRRSSINAAFSPAARMTASTASGVQPATDEKPYIPPRRTRAETPDDSERWFPTIFPPRRTIRRLRLFCTRTVVSAPGRKSPFFSKTKESSIWDLRLAYFEKCFFYKIIISQCTPDNKIYGIEKTHKKN